FFRLFCHACWLHTFPTRRSSDLRLAPAHMASLIMGTWFFASATGNFAAGLIASATGAEAVGEESGKEVVLDVYMSVGWVAIAVGDRKSTRLNSSHVKISYAVFCL